MASPPLPVAPSSQFIQRAYIAFFNRPADKEGLDFWQGATSDKALLDDFAQSPEYLSDYVDKSNRQIIEIIYKNLFGRGPEQEGWDYWTQQMDKGWITVSNAAYEIMGGAQGTDLDTVNNKTTAAQAFTNALDSPVKANAYANAGINGVGNVTKEWLATVSYDSASLSTAQANLNGILSKLIIYTTYTEPMLPDPLPPGDNLWIVNGSGTVTFSTDPNTKDTLKFSTDPNVADALKPSVKVINFGAEDHLDFTTYGASALFASTLVNNVAESQRWLGDMHLSAGCKYISLTRTDASSTEYKIELWTLQGNVLDAYGGQGFSVGPGPEKPDTAQLIGYVNLGLDLNAGASIHVDL